MCVALGGRTVLVLRASLSWNERSSVRVWDWSIAVDAACVLTILTFSPLSLCPPRVPVTGRPHSQVKNSWGADWGADGYILLEREAPEIGGECGILMQASYPVLA